MVRIALLNILAVVCLIESSQGVSITALGNAFKNRTMNFITEGNFGKIRKNGRGRAPIQPPDNPPPPGPLPTYNLTHFDEEDGPCLDACRAGDPGNDCHCYKSDIIFLVDRSKSIYPEDLKLVLHFVHDFVRDFVGVVHPVHGARFGFIVFAKGAHTLIKLKHTSTKAEFLNKLAKVGKRLKLAKFTETHTGLKAAKYEHDRNPRCGAKKVVILTTDGRTWLRRRKKVENPPTVTIDAAKSVKMAGIHIFVIGTPNYKERNTGYEAEWRYVASTPIDCTIINMQAEVDGYQPTYHDLAIAKEYIAHKICNVDYSNGCSDTHHPAVDAFCRDCMGDFFDHKTCEGHGDIHFRTYDEHKNIDHQAKCIQTMSRVCRADCNGLNAWQDVSAAPGAGCGLIEFHIKVRPEYDLNRELAYVGDVIIDVCGYTVFMNRDHSWAIIHKTASDSVNGETIPLNKQISSDFDTLPQTLACEKGTEINLFLIGAMMVFTLSVPWETNYILRVEHMKRNAKVHLRGDYYNKVCGMCGNYDDNAANDLITRGNQDVSGYEEHNIHSERDTMIGNSWKLFDPNNPFCTDLTPDEVKQLKQSKYGRRKRATEEELEQLCIDAFDSVKKCSQYSDNYQNIVDLCKADIVAIGEARSKQVVCEAVKAARAYCAPEGCEIKERLDGKFDDLEAQYCSARCEFDKADEEPWRRTALCNPCQTSPNTCGGTQTCTQVRKRPAWTCSSVIRDNRTATLACPMRLPCAVNPDMGIDGRHGTCIAWGDVHVVTFDNKKIDHQGICMFTLARLCRADCDGDNAWEQPSQPGPGCNLVEFHVKLQPFIYVRRDPSDPRSGPTVPKEVAVDICGYSIILRPDKTWIVTTMTEAPPIFIQHGDASDLPLLLMCEKGTVIQLEKSTAVYSGKSWTLDAIALIVWSPLEGKPSHILKVQIAKDGPYSGLVRVDVRSDYSNELCGTCGDFDGDGLNDVVTRGGEDVSGFSEDGYNVFSERDAMVGNSWKLFNPDDTMCIDRTPDEIIKLYETYTDWRRKRALDPEEFDWLKELARRECERVFGLFSQCNDTNSEDYNRGLRMCMSDILNMGRDSVKDMLLAAVTFSADVCLTRPGTVAQPETCGISRKRRQPGGPFDINSCDYRTDIKPTFADLLKTLNDPNFVIDVNPPT